MVHNVKVNRHTVFRFENYYFRQQIRFTSSRLNKEKMTNRLQYIQGLDKAQTLLKLYRSYMKPVFRNQVT